MPLNIPESDRRKLAKLVAFSAEQFESLYRAVEQSAPAVNAIDFLDHVREHTDLDHRSLSDAVRFLLSLSWVQLDQSLASDYLAAEVERVAHEHSIPNPKIGWGSFKGTIERFLSLERPLGITAKATYIALQFPHHFHTAHVFTDARPVFGLKAESEPLAFLINHSLQLRVHGDDVDTEWYVALNTNDLEELRAVVDRALAKERSLRELLAKTGAPVLSSE